MNEPTSLHRHTDRYRQTDTEIHPYIHRQTDRDTSIHTYRHTDRQTDTYVHNNINQYIYSAVLIAEKLREFTRFTR